MSIPSISVIIPTYNRSHTIDKCLQSVFNQTHSVNEIIVVDDCSTDNSMEILKSYTEIKILKTKINSGAQVARNIGIKAAKSDWITFLDSDDEWLPDKIEKQLLALKSVNSQYNTVVHGDCIVKNIETKNEHLWELVSIEGEDVYQKLLTQSGTFFPAIFTSKQALEEIGYLDENIISYQEWDTSISLSKFCKFIHIHKPLFYYYIHDNTISKSSKNNIQGYYNIVDKFKDSIIENCGTQVYNDHISKCASMAMNSKEYEWGRKILSNLPYNMKKIILLSLSYLRVKPIYLFQSLKYLSWKN